MGIQQKTISRKQYSSQFKREAVRLVTEGGLSMAQVARDLGLNDNLVSRWKKEAEQNGPRAFPGQGHPQDEELSRRREVEVLRQEREVLPSAISPAHKWAPISQPSR
jgi:transposase-like protein